MTIHDVPNVEIKLFVVLTQRTRATVTQTNRTGCLTSTDGHASCRIFPLNIPCTPVHHAVWLLWIPAYFDKFIWFLGFYIFSHIVILLYIFRVRHSRGEMYNGHGRVSVCLSLAASHITARTYLDVSWGNCRGCPLVVHRWTDLQSVHGFRCYDDIAPNAKCQRVRILDLCLVLC